MGRYDDIDPESVRRQLVRVARLILRLDEEGEILREAPRLQKLLGDLRQRLFAYEVRATARLRAESGADAHEAEGAREMEDPLLSESLRIVREAIERQRELREDLESGGESRDESDGDERD